MANFSFNIDDFTSVIQRRGGLQSPNRYSVRIQSPVPGASSIENDIPLLAENVAFAGRSIATSDYKTYGPVIKVGRESIYSDLSITFILTNDMEMKTYFDKWMNKVQNDITYDPNYYDSYVGNIFIGQLKSNEEAKVLQGKSNANKFSYAQQIQDAFPTAVADVALGHAENNTYGKLQVTFTYRKSINLNL